MLWREILAELHTRGAGIRESGAFLLAECSVGQPSPSGTPVVVAAAYYDDLDAACLTGGITMSGAAYDRLWQRCREEGLRVVADIHTHPGDWVDQSHIDKANPMMALAGHIAVIVGNFADPTRGAVRVGVHRYSGNGEWETLPTREPPAQVARGSHDCRWLGRLASLLRRRK